MKEEHRKYAQEVYDIVNHASKNIGSRLPGTDNEKKFAAYMGDKLREIGIEPIREEFAVSPRASIGGIPYAGWVGLALSALVYIAMGIPSVWYGMALVSIAVIVWLVCSVFLYKTWFDMFFKQEISQNTYGELLPEDGKYDYTIVLSGHTDTSWNWRHSEHSYTKPKLGAHRYLRQGRIRCALLLLPRRHFYRRCDYLHRILFRRRLGSRGFCFARVCELYVRYALYAPRYRHRQCVPYHVGRSRSAQRFARRYG